MVNYKVRAFCEPEDEDSIGAEVRIYSDEGDQIDTILITTESKYKELEDRIDQMDEDYIDLDELKALLADAEENQIIIDAATLGGLASNQYARAEHNESHTPYFAPIDHSLETSRYGLGNTTKYGHVKIINNLDSNSLTSGEALAANQGNVLRELINTVKRELTTWTTITCGSYGTLYVNASLRLCRFIYKRSDYKSSKTGWVDLHSSAIIPATYRPKLSVFAATAYSNVVSYFMLNASGEASTKVIQANTKGTVNAELFWMY